VLTDATSTIAVPSFRIAVDGREDTEGCALLALSAIHLCGTWLKSTELNVIGSSGTVVDVALEALSWDTGVAVQHWRAEDRGVIADCDLLLAVRRFSPDWDMLAHAERAGVGTIVAIQFPRLDDLSAAAFLGSVREAHDSAMLATRIEARLPGGSP